MRRRMRGGPKKNFNDVPANGTLTDRAVRTGLVYNYLEYVSPKDVDGLRRAYVNVDNDKIDARPIPANKASVAQMYGANKMKPTIIAGKTEPTALISKYSPKDKMFPQLEEYGNELLRSALRKIVDEV